MNVDNSMSEPLQTEYERILRAMARDPKTTPDEDWETLHSKERNFEEVFTSQIQNAPENLHERLREEFLGSGPLKPLFQDPEVTEILVMGESTLLYEKGGRLLCSEERFLGTRTFQRFIHQLLEEAGLSLNLKTPFADGRWKEFRIHAIQPPVTQMLCISLRRQKAHAWTLNDLLHRHWCSESWGAKLSSWVKAGMSLIVFGDTGSGKTATAEALLNELPRDCRALILEDTPEIRAPNSFSVTLQTRRAVEDLREVTFMDLLKQSLRMRPDRIIMGEIRAEEAKDFLMVLASGHAGGLATLHAPSARQALLRLEMLVQLGAPQWDLRSVRVLIAQSVHYLIHVGRDESGARRLLSVSKIDGLEENGLLLESYNVREKPEIKD